VRPDICPTCKRVTPVGKMVCPFCPPSVRRQQMLGAVAAYVINAGVIGLVIAVIYVIIFHRGKW